MPGKPVQFEIPADDTTRGRRFWGSLFGWQFEESHGLFEYDVAQVDDHLGAAVTDMDPAGAAGDPRPVPGTASTRTSPRPRAAPNPRRCRERHQPAAEVP